MFQKVQAVCALQHGCRQLGLPTTVAVALVQFLSVKRVHDQFVGSKQLHLSPGAKMEQLWRWMLLNTAVAKQVHELVGSAVEYCSDDQAGASDEVKLLQRLYAFNILKLEGHNPDLQLWTESGSCVQTLHWVLEPHLNLSGLATHQQPPQGCKLYLTPDISKTQRVQLVQALQLLYADQGTVSGGNGPTGGQQQQQQQPASHVQRPQPAAATAAAAAAAAGACHGARAAKRPCIEQHHGGMAAEQLIVQPQQLQAQRQQEQQQAQGVDGRVSITVMNQPGDTIVLKVKQCARLCSIMSTVEQHWSINIDDYKVLYNGQDLGRAIEGDTTVGQLGMRQGDVLHIMLKQTGC